MCSLRGTRTLLIVSLVLLLPYIALRILFILACVFSDFYAEFVDFLQLVVTASADSYYVYKGMRALIKMDERLITKCHKYFTVCFILSVLSLIMTTCLDDEEMMAIAFETINIFALSFSGASLFLLNMKLLDQKEETNNNAQFVPNI